MHGSEDVSPAQGDAGLYGIWAMHRANGAHFAIIDALHEPDITSQRGNATALIPALRRWQEQNVNFAALARLPCGCHPKAAECRPSMLYFAMHTRYVFTVDALLQVEDGDTILIDAEQHIVEAVNVSPEELGRRLAAWTAPPLKFTQGTLYKYIKNVSSASLGCVTDL